MSLIEKLVIGGKYKWKHEPQVLFYIGKKNGWHQFTLNGSVWCECLDSDLNLMECVFEVGDKLVGISDDDFDNDIFEIKKIYSFHNKYCFDYETRSTQGDEELCNFRHATNKEITQGYRDD